MKRLSVFILLLVFATACNKEKIYQDDLNGTWTVYKFLKFNIDRTTDFQAMNGADYSISFTTDGKYVEMTTFPDTFMIAGTYTFENHFEQIVLTDSVYTKRTYTIFNLTKDHVQLRDDSTQLYMQKTI